MADDDTCTCDHCPPSCTCGQTPPAEGGCCCGETCTCEACTCGPSCGCPNSAN